MQGRRESVCVCRGTTTDVLMCMQYPTHKKKVKTNRGGGMLCLLSSLVLVIPLSVVFAGGIFGRFLKFKFRVALLV